jgi:HK97 gp10 family phage protein
MADEFRVSITGVDEAVKALRALPAKLRNRAILNSLRIGARLFRDEARRLTPILKLTTQSGANAFRKGYRKPGTVRKAISVRTSKRDRRAGDVGVFVNVRPAQKGNRGAKNPNDPFYWRWLEFGRKAWSFGGKRKSAGGAMQGAGFLRGAVRKGAEVLRVTLAKMAPEVQKVIDRESKKVKP